MVVEWVDLNNVGGSDARSKSKPRVKHNPDWMYFLEVISARIILAVESEIEAVAILSQIAVVRVTHPVEADWGLGRGSRSSQSTWLCTRCGPQFIRKDWLLQLVARGSVRSLMWLRQWRNVVGSSVSWVVWFRCEVVGGGWCVCVCWGDRIQVVVVMVFEHCGR